MEHPEITLGDHTFPVYPQRHAYLTNRVGKLLEEVVGDAGDFAQRFQETTDFGGMLALLGDGTYRLLDAMVPNLTKRIPEYEFAGFDSKEAREAGEYDPDKDRSPTFPEILTAFETAAKVSRFDVLQVVKKAVWGPLIDPKVVRQRITLWIAETGERADSIGSPSSLGTSGESLPNSSGTTDLTSESSESQVTREMAVNGSRRETSESPSLSSIS